MDDNEASFFTMGLGRPKAPPKAGAGAPKAGLGAPVVLVLVLVFPYDAPELLVLLDGLGRDEEWVGFVGGSAERRLDSVRSEISLVSSCPVRWDVQVDCRITSVREINSPCQQPRRRYQTHPAAHPGHW